MWRFAAVVHPSPSHQPKERADCSDDQRSRNGGRLPPWPHCVVQNPSHTILGLVRARLVVDYLWYLFIIFIIICSDCGVFWSTFHFFTCNHQFPKGKTKPDEERAPYYFESITRLHPLICFASCGGAHTRVSPRWSCLGFSWGGLLRGSLDSRCCSSYAWNPHRIVEIATLRHDHKDGSCSKRDNHYHRSNTPWRSWFLSLSFFIVGGWSSSCILI